MLAPAGQVSGALPAGAVTVPDVSSLPPAVQAALAQIADEISNTAPGVVKELVFSVRTAAFGRVGIRLEATPDGLIRVELATATAQAAQALREGLPGLAQILEGRPVPVEFAPVAVGAALGFGGSAHGWRPPRWFEHSGVPGEDEGPGGTAPETASRGRFGALSRVDFLA